MTEQSVRVDRTAAVATITLTAAALTNDTKVALRDAIADVANDATVRAAVLAGSGKAFCVGQDLGEHSAGLVDGAEDAFATVREHYSPIVRDLLTMPKPVIAAVGGACVGAGLGLALACDYRVFAAGTKLGTAFTGIGLTFDSGLSFTLPRAVGDARAKQLILFGDVFTAEDGIAWGRRNRRAGPGPPSLLGARPAIGAGANRCLCGEQAAHPRRFWAGRRPGSRGGRADAVRRDLRSCGCGHGVPGTGEADLRRGLT